MNSIHKYIYLWEQCRSIGEKYGKAKEKNWTSRNECVPKYDCEICDIIWYFWYFEYEKKMVQILYYFLIILFYLSYHKYRLSVITVKFRNLFESNPSSNRGFFFAFGNYFKSPEIWITWKNFHWKTKLYLYTNRNRLVGTPFVTSLHI